MLPSQASVLRVPVSATGRNIVRTLGLSFRNCIGIAAGIDRDGRLLPALAGLTAGHIEIGTVTDPYNLQIPRTLSPHGSIVGINIGSAKAGFSDKVLIDYRACLLQALSCAGYITLNFSSEAAQRRLKSEDGHRILSMARNEIDRRSAKNSARTPLLAKVPAGAPGEDLPITQSMAEELDGLILVGDRSERIAEIRAAFPGHGIVSVGGVRSAEDVLARRRAGSDLVQVHSLYAEGGSAAIERIMLDIEGGLDG